MEMLNIAPSLKQPSMPENKPTNGDKSSKESFSDFLNKETVQGQNPEGSDPAAADKTPAIPEKPEEPKGQEGLLENPGIPAILIPPLFPNQATQLAQTTGSAAPTAGNATVAPAVPAQEVVLPTAGSAEAVVDNVAAQNNTTNVAPQAQQAMEMAPAAEEDVALLKQQALTQMKSTTDGTADQMIVPEEGDIRQAKGSEALHQMPAAQNKNQTQPVAQSNVEQETITPVTAEQKTDTQNEKQDGTLLQMSQGNTSEAKTAAPVKEAAPTAYTHREEPTMDMQKLSQTMMKELAKGKTEMEILLEPAHLGKMAIKVTYEAGKAAVSIICTNEKTMELISQNAKTLGNILDQHMGTKTVVVVEHPEADYLQQQNNQQNQKEQQQQQEGREAGQQENSKEADSLTFLQQLRLGLA